MPQQPDGAAIKEPEWPQSNPLMAALAERDGGWHCHYCGNKLASGLADLIGPRADGGYSCRAGFSFAEADHVVPRSRGGSDGIENRVLSCSRCNQRKGCRPAEVFVAEVRR